MVIGLYSETVVMVLNGDDNYYEAIVMLVMNNGDIDSEIMLNDDNNDEKHLLYGDDIEREAMVTIGNDYRDDDKVVVIL